jgi:hypothetical protein
MDKISTPTDEHEYKNSNRIGENSTEDMMNKLREQREAEIRSLQNKPPVGF